MPEFQRILREIKIAKRKGRKRLYISREVSCETVSQLKEMGYLVLQVYVRGYIDTIVGWGNDND